MSNHNTPEGVASNGAAPDGPSDPVSENLVSLALGQLSGDEANRVRESIASDPVLARQFESIRAHLDLHSQVREIQPMPGGFDRLRARLETEPHSPAEAAAAAPAGERPRSFFRRYWLSFAAAALLLVAVFVPRGDEGPLSGSPHIVALAGQPVEDADGNWASDGICRIAYGDGVTITLDADTTVIPIANQRLALRAGRIFVDVEPGRRGFTIELGDGQIMTMGTSFLVERSLAGENRIAGRVAVESGRVAYRLGDATGDVSAGDELRWTSPALDGPAARVQSVASGTRLRWFEIPGLSAKILNDRTVVVVIRNEMLDPIQLAPPTGGEPLFYATVGSHSYPHAPANFGRNVVLEPGTDFTFEMKLPQPLQPGQEVVIRCPSLNLEARAAKANTETGR